MATGRATIRGRSGRSASGKKVSKYSPQYSQTTGKKAEDRGTTKASIAMSDLTSAQKSIASSLGLSKTQVLSLTDRQVSTLSSNIPRMSSSQLQKLKSIYGSVSTRQAKLSGVTGLSKIDIQKLKQQTAQRAFGAGGESGGKVLIREAQNIIQRGSAQSRASTLKKYNPTTKRYEIPTTTLQNLSGNVKTKGDYNLVLREAQQTVYGASPSEKQRIMLARKYIVKTSSSDAGDYFNTIDKFAQWDSAMSIAETPITATTSKAETRRIKNARDWILKNAGKINRYSNKPTAKDFSDRFKSIDSPYGELSKVVPGAAPFASGTIMQQVTESIDNSGFLSDLGFGDYEAQERTRTSKAAETEEIAKNAPAWMRSSIRAQNALQNALTTKSVSAKLPSEEAVANFVKHASVIGFVNKITDDYVTGSILEGVSAEYSGFKQDPLLYAGQTGALLTVGAGLGAGTRVVSKASAAAVRKAAPKIATKTLPKVSGKTIPVVGRVTVQQLPETVVGTYFLTEIANAYAGTAAVGGKPLRETAEGSYISSLARSIQRGDKVQYVSPSTVSLVKDLALMGVGFRAGSRAVSRSAAREAKAPATETTTVRSFRQGLRETTPKVETGTLKQYRSSLRTREAAAKKTKASQTKKPDIKQYRIRKATEEAKSVLKERQELADKIKTAQEKATTQLEATQGVTKTDMRSAKTKEKYAARNEAARARIEARKAAEEKEIAGLRARREAREAAEGKPKRISKKPSAAEAQSGRQVMLLKQKQVKIQEIILEEVSSITRPKIRTRAELKLKSEARTKTRQKRITKRETAEETRRKPLVRTGAISTQKTGITRVTIQKPTTLVKNVIKELNTNVLKSDSVNKIVQDTAQNVITATTQRLRQEQTQAQKQAQRLRQSLRGRKVKEGTEIYREQKEIVLPIGGKEDPVRVVTTEEVNKLRTAYSIHKGTLGNIKSFIG